MNKLLGYQDFASGWHTVWKCNYCHKYWDNNYGIIKELTKRHACFMYPAYVEQKEIEEEGKFELIQEKEIYICKFKPNTELSLHSSQVVKNFLHFFLWKEKKEQRNIKFVFNLCKIKLFNDCNISDFMDILISISEIIYKTTQYGVFIIPKEMKGDLEFSQIDKYVHICFTFEEAMEYLTRNDINFLVTAS
jgi:hypothetical protein